MATFMDSFDMQLCSGGVKTLKRVARIPATMTVTATPMARREASRMGNMNTMATEDKTSPGHVLIRRGARGLTNYSLFRLVRLDRFSLNCSCRVVLKPPGQTDSMRHCLGSCQLRCLRCCSREKAAGLTAQTMQTLALQALGSRGYGLV